MDSWMVEKIMNIERTVTANNQMLAGIVDAINSQITAEDKKDGKKKEEKE